MPIDPTLAAVADRLEDFTAKGLALAVSRAVGDRAVEAGALLPPIRTVAVQLGLSPTTVSSAWRTLASAGVVETDGRRGSRIAVPRSPRPERYGRVVDRRPADLLDLSSGVPDPELLPDLSPALARLPRATVPQSYLDDPVLPDLRRHLLADWPVAAEDLLVTDGAMDGIELASRSLLRFGDRAAVEHPAFPPLLDLLESLGVDVVALPVDEEGADETAFAQAAAAGVAAVYLQPRAQNPTGVCLSPRRARRLAAIAREHGVPVVEDDSIGSVSSVEPISVGAWAPALTIHVRSYSKSHGPDLRLAALTAPPAVFGRIVARRQLGQGWTSRLLQRVLLDLLTDPVAGTAVEQARETYAARRRGLQDALAARGIACPGSDGLNLWIPVVDESAALVHLAGHGITAAPGAPFAAGATLAPHLRLTTAALAGEPAAYADLLADAAQRGPWSTRAR